MDKIKRIARIAGILYLIIIICAGFSEGYIRSNLIIGGDAISTANNIMNSETLFRVGFVGDLIAFISDAIISILLYVLLKPVNKILSLITASLRLLAHPAIASINLLNHFAALHLLSGADYLAVFETDQLYAMVMLFLNFHKTGYLIAGAFFGLHLILLGYLLVKSNYFPGILGFLLTFAGVGYIVESFGNFLFPEYKELFAWIVVLPAAIGELSLALWFLIKGIKDSSPIVKESSQ